MSLYSGNHHLIIWGKIGNMVTEYGYCTLGLNKKELKMVNESWNISTASDDILNFIVYTGCVYGLIDNMKYNGKEILWPKKSLDTDVYSTEWEELFIDIVNLEVGKIGNGKHPYSIIEEYLPPEFLYVKSQTLRKCCKDVWPMFQDWWYMFGGGKNALNFIEGILNNNLFDYVNEVERMKERKLRPFNLYISLLYTGLNKTLELDANGNRHIIITSDPIGTLNKEWWIKKLNVIG